MQKIRPAGLIKILLLTIAMIGSSNTSAQSDISEYQIKAAFLYKFATYIEWPDYTFDNSESPIVFGIIAADRLAATLDKIISNRTIHGRPIRVQVIEPESVITNIHVLFIGRSQDPAIDAKLLTAAESSVLTVTETVKGRLTGSMINFETIDNKIRFDVALDLAEQGKLRISSRLLQVAHKVITSAL